MSKYKKNIQRMKTDHTSKPTNKSKHQKGQNKKNGNKSRKKQQQHKNTKKYI